MNKSLQHRLMDLEKHAAETDRRLKALERPVVANIAQVLPLPPQPGTITTATPAVPQRSMCPKCGVKPNYFFHVKTCNGQQKEQKNADTEPGRNTGKA